MVFVPSSPLEKNAAPRKNKHAIWARRDAAHLRQQRRTVFLPLNKKFLNYYGTTNVIG
jgi:hypothetical protein